MPFPSLTLLPSRALFPAASILGALTTFMSQPIATRDLASVSIPARVVVYLNGVPMRSVAVTLVPSPRARAGEAVGVLERTILSKAAGPALSVAEAEAVGEAERFVVGRSPVVTSTREAVRSEIARAVESAKVVEA